MAAGLLAVCSAAAAQSVTTYGYDARGRLTAVRSGIGVRSDYNLDAADNRSGYHAAQQFATAYAATSLPHVVGYADSGGWAVSAGTSGFMTYGPYTTSVPAGSHVATWRLMVDNTRGIRTEVLVVSSFAGGNATHVDDITRELSKLGGCASSLGLMNLDVDTSSRSLTAVSE